MTDRAKAPSHRMEYRKNWAWGCRRICDRGHEALPHDARSCNKTYLHICSAPPMTLLNVHMHVRLGGKKCGSDIKKKNAC